MTCIIGYTDKKNKITYLGCDSCASNGNDLTTMNTDKKKVFRVLNSDILLGFSGTARDLNLLHYAENLIQKEDKNNISEKFIITKFIPNIIKLFEKNGRCYLNNNQKEMDNFFLIGYKDNIWKIEPNYAVIKTDLNFSSIGSGSDYALGAMHILKDINFLNPIEKIHKALKVSSKYCSCVAPPFYIMNTKDFSIIKLLD